jgi:hypothetical protein
MSLTGSSLLWRRYERNRISFSLHYKLLIIYRLTMARLCQTRQEYQSRRQRQVMVSVSFLDFSLLHIKVYTKQYTQRNCEALHTFYAVIFNLYAMYTFNFARTTKHAFGVTLMYAFSLDWAAAMSIKLWLIDSTCILWYVGMLRFVLKNKVSKPVFYALSNGALGFPLSW